MSNDRFKFRAWDCRDNTLFEVDRIDTYSHGMWVLGGCRELEIKESRLMQSTGLKDRKGKLIFEGDVIKDRLDQVYEVVFQDLEFCTFSIKHRNINGKTSFHSFKGCDDMEIIGNIHQNPELLEVSK